MNVRESPFAHVRWMGFPPRWGRWPSAGPVIYFDFGPWRWYSRG